jgi:hypothetical protein
MNWRLLIRVIAGRVDHNALRAGEGDAMNLKCRSARKFAEDAQQGCQAQPLNEDGERNNCKVRGDNGLA